MPGPEREHHGVVAAARRAVAPLGEHRAVGVVVDAHGQAEPLGHQRLEARRPPSGRCGDAGDDSVAAVHHARARRSRRAATSASDRAPRPRAPSRRARRAAGRCSRSCDERCARWWTASLSSTTPASSFVPPTSTPMTHVAGHGRHHIQRWPPTCRRRRTAPASRAHVPRPTAPAHDVLQRGGGASLDALRRDAPRRAQRAGASVTARALRRPDVPGAPAPPSAHGGAPAARHLACRALDRARARRLDRALDRALPGQRAVPAGSRSTRRDEVRADVGGAPIVSPSTRAGPRLRRAAEGLARAGRADQRPRALGLDPADARRRRAQREAVDPARHGRRRPRLRPEQDQRRLRARRLGARRQDGQAVPRDRHRPRDPRELRRTSRS